MEVIREMIFDKLVYSCVFIDLACLCSIILCPLYNSSTKLKIRFWFKFFTTEPFGNKVLNVWRTGDIQRYTKFAST